MLLTRALQAVLLLQGLAAERAGGTAGEGPRYQPVAVPASTSDLPTSLPAFLSVLTLRENRDSVGGGGLRSRGPGEGGSVAAAPHLIFVEGAGHPVPQRAQGPPHLGALLHLLCAVHLVLVPAHVCCCVYVDRQVFVTPGESKSNLLVGQELVPRDVP